MKAKDIKPLAKYGATRWAVVTNQLSVKDATKSYLWDVYGTSRKHAIERFLEEYNANRRSTPSLQLKNWSTAYRKGFRIVKVNVTLAN